MPSIGISLPYPEAEKKSSEHLLGRMLSGLLNMCFSDWLTNTFSSVPRSITKHFKVRFIGEYNSFPQFCTTIFIFLAQWSRFFITAGVNNCFFLGFLAILTPVRNLFRIVDGSSIIPDTARSLCNSLLVFQKALTVFLIIMLTTLAVVFLFLPHLPRRWMLTSFALSAIFAILPAVDFAKPKRFPIALISGPQTFSMLGQIPVLSASAGRIILCIDYKKQHA